MSKTGKAARRQRDVRDVLMSDMTAEGVRRFCTLHDVERARGETKEETVDAIMKQAPEAAASWLRAHGYTVEDV